MPISLPETPTGDQYEDLVVATLRAQGYFVEPRLTLRENNKEVLELDVVASPAGAPTADRILYEAKKGGIHFGDLFKLFGQRIHLEIPRACLVSLLLTDPQYLPTYEAKGRELNVQVCHYAIGSPADNLAVPRNGLTNEQRERLIAASWYGQIAQRTAIGALLNECKKRAGTACCDDARKYLFNVRAAFFQAEPLARAEALYSAYFTHPRLTGDAVGLMASESGIRSERAAWNRVTDGGEWLWVQAIMYLESSARFVIVKNALDDFLVRGAAPPPATTLKLGSLSVDIPLHALPGSFHAGLRRLRDHPYGTRIPYLFQAVFELLGGFVMIHDDVEMDFLATLTGIPRDDLVPALRLIDDFFGGNDQSMLYEHQNELLCFKMIPGFVRGGGSFARKIVFDINDYRKRYPRTGWLLGQWHNSLYKILEPVLR